MSAEEIIRLIFSFVGGGIVVAAIDWIRTNKSEKINRRVDFLNNQIGNLYGPLYYFTSKNEQLFNLSDQIHEAYDIEYIKPEWSRDKSTQASLKKETTQTLNIANDYIALVQDNNEKIIEIFTKNYSFIDPDDIETFKYFMIDYTRLKTEINKDGILRTPFRIYQRMGSISFMRPKFIERVERKFHEKIKELRTYEEQSSGCKSFRLYLI